MSETKKKYWLWILVVVAILLVIGLFVFKGRGEAQPESLKTLIIQPTQKHSATVIFLHGLGNNATGQKTELKPIAKNYPHIKFIFPEAPTIPVSMSWGRRAPSWYDIKGNPNDIINLKQDKKGLLKSVEQIEKIIREEVNSGILPEKIMVMGHSQGGSMALAIGLLTEYKLAGIACFSGFLPCREEIFNWAKEKNKEIPFRLYHNRYDNIVPSWVGDKSANLLKNKGYQAEFDNLYNGAHFFKANELAKIIAQILTPLS